jgi:hypothetical protein
MESLEYIRAYLHYCLCISRNSIEDHLEKLDKVLRPLCNTVLKVNTKKMIFCAIEVEFLGYILTRDGNKPQSNKVLAILTIQPPKGVRQLRHFLGMVQYYQDLWVRWSTMLAPLTSLVGECGQTKVTKAKEPQRYPGTGTRSIKELSITYRLPLQTKQSWPIWTNQMSLRFTQMLPTNS